jgi:hypothetical protein
MGHTCEELGSNRQQSEENRLGLGLRLSRGYQVLIHHVMARAYPIYEARAKVSEILRRVTAAETSLCHFRIIK